MKKVIPMLWYDSGAVEAVTFYTSLIEGSGIDDIQYYPDGRLFSVRFHLGDLHLTAIDGGPHFKFTEAISLMLLCKDQAELDEKWAAISDGGEELAMGWLKDRWGLTWQVIPEKMDEWLLKANPGQSKRIWAAMEKQPKPNFADLEAAMEEPK